MPSLSIILPHYGSTGLLENTLATVLQNRPADCEVLLVHPGTYDDPYDLACEVRFVEVAAGSSQVDGLNAAMQAATGAFIHIILPGVEVGEFWCANALARFDDPKTAAVCPLVLRRDTPRRIAIAGVRVNWLGQRRVVGAGARNRRSRITRLGPVGPSLAAAFYRRDALERIGWFATDIAPSFADIDVALALRQAGYVCCFEPESVLWLADKIDRQQGLPFETGRGSERVIWRHAPVLGGRRTTASRPFIIAGQLALGVAGPKRFKHALGRLSACFEIARHRRYWREMACILAENSLSEQWVDSISMSPERSSDAAHGCHGSSSMKHLRQAS